MIQRPVAVGLMVCETVIVDEQSKNVTPVNCFRRRRVAGFPTEPFPFVICAWLTDGIGQGNLEVVIQRLGEDEIDEVYQAVLPCRFTNPMDEVRLTIRIRDCVFPSAGAYSVTLLADGEFLAHERLILLRSRHRE